MEEKEGPLTVLKSSGEMGVVEVSPQQWGSRRVNIWETGVWSHRTWNWLNVREGECPGGSGVKNLLAKQETRAQSLGREDPLEKKMATLSSTHACRIPWTEEPGGLQSVRSQRVRQGLGTEHVCKGSEEGVSCEGEDREFNFGQAPSSSLPWNYVVCIFAKELIILFCDLLISLPTTLKRLKSRPTSYVYLCNHRV